MGIVIKNHLKEKLSQKRTENKKIIIGLEILVKKSPIYFLIYNGFVLLLE